MTKMEEPTISLLSKLAISGNLPHALVFSGGAGEYKKRVASLFASWLLHTGVKENFLDFFQKSCACRLCECIVHGIHPDFVRIDESPVPIQKIRDLKRVFSLAPFVAQRKIAVIEHAETLHKEAANAFLKLLEEPRGEAVFILLANARSNLLPTIYSRAVEIRFPHVSSFEVEEAIAQKYREFSEVFAGATLYQKFMEARKYTLASKEDLLKMLDLWLCELRNDVRSKEFGHSLDLMHRIFQVKSLLVTTHMNPELLMEELSMQSTP